MRWISLLTFGLCALLAAASAAHAQAVGGIVGLVTDPNGGVLPGVTVTVAGSGLQRPLAVQTTLTGTYHVSNVPIGTYSVTFELTGFKQATREPVVLTTGFTAKVDMKLEVGSIDQHVDVTGAPPLVDTKRTTTGATITAAVLNAVPTTRDFWAALNLTPGLVLGGVEFDNAINVGGSLAAQQQNVEGYATTPFGPGTNGGASPNNIYSEWNLEGGNITNMSVPVAPTYFNFDSLQEVQVITGGGDVAVQSAGTFINLITKSGSNTVRGTAGTTFENSTFQAQNVTQALFSAAGANGIGLSGNPIHRIDTFNGDLGGPLRKNRLWYWGAASTQDINLSIGDFFDTSLPGCNPPPSTFAQLNQIQGCLTNQQTRITNFNGKLNYQLNTANRFQALVQTAQQVVDNYQASVFLAPQATLTAHNTGGDGVFQNPLYQLTHTWLPTRRIVVVNQVTYLRGGMYADSSDWTRCGPSSYARTLAGQDPTDPSCLFNVQTLINTTTGTASRSPADGVYDAEDRSLELKSDATYASLHGLGGDHAFKFGVGWRSGPYLSYSHNGGGAQAYVQCANNGNCGDGTFVAPGSSAGLLPYQAALRRDSVVNADWYSYFGYAQDTYTTGRMTATAGIRDDWQTSVLNPACVGANPVMPSLLPAQCQGRVDPKQPFNNLAPRLSVTDDLFGDGRTALHGSFAMYYASNSRLAYALNALTPVELDWGPNLPSGACDPLAGSCWSDANHDGIIQANELSGVPSGPANFVNGVLSAALPTIDPDLQLGRVREGIGGVDRQLWGNVHATFDFIYRDYDRGLAPYIVAPSGTAAGAIAQIVNATTDWQPNSYTDPKSGITTTYYTLCSGCVKVTGPKFTTTSLPYTIYKGVTVSLTKRLANRWQGSLSYTWNDPRVYMPPGSFSTNSANPGDPTNIQYLNGFTNGTLAYTLKAYGSVLLPYGLTAGLNFNAQAGAVREEYINGPGPVGNGTSYSTLLFQDLNASHFPSTRILDLNVAKSFDLGRPKLSLILNCFNVFNVNTPLQYASDDVSNSGLFNAVTSIVPPRVFRVDARISF